MKIKTINIKEDFSETPLGRYKTHGPANGERFREEFLIPALKHFDKIEIVLDGVAGLPSSFLEEAFGGLVRKLGWTAKQFAQRVNLVATDAAFDLSLLRISRYVQSAGR